MKSILTFDYELFFGKKTGTPQVCMIDSTNRLLQILDKYDSKAVFFVDVTYLLKLKALCSQHSQLQTDYADVIGHIKKLESEGHQIQLHIHPHWLDSTFNGVDWELNHVRYKLADWTKEEAADIIRDSVRELNSHLVNSVFAYRAGGWCIQPFSHLSEAFQENNIWLDSTVFKGGRSKSLTHSFDFLSAPNASHWHFDQDPCVEVSDGYFTEVPISSVKVSPVFYWKFAIAKKLGNKSLHSQFGDGSGIQSGRLDMIRMLTRYTNSVVSADGYKSSLLVNAYKKALRANDEYFVVIGHPKLLTKNSLINIEKWLSFLVKNGDNLSLYNTEDKN